MLPVFALIDCNNFYVSCERVFNPRLRARPVVVLSNNDGCIISRSEEAKAVGIKMGAPVFHAQELIGAHRVEVFSSNYSLYGDMSHRVMETLREFTPEVEVYSIDEAFLRLAGLRHEKLTEMGNEMRETVRRWTGIPISVGIAPTKTLAKIAVSLAKHSNKARGVVNLCGSPYMDAALSRVGVEDVWGVGRNRARLLKDKGIVTARDLRSADDHWIRNHLSVTGLRIVHELRGNSCLPFEQCPPSKKSITVSRSFADAVDSLEDLREAVACHVSKAAEKLRRARLAARVMMVFLATNRFSDTPQYSPSVMINLPVPTDLTPELVRYAHEGVERAFRPGYQFKKAGVMLVDLVPASPAQGGLFDRVDRARARRLMKVIDMINARMGPGTIQCASLGFKHRWHTRFEKRSPRYTTRWSELLMLPGN